MAGVHPSFPVAQNRAPSFYLHKHAPLNQPSRLNLPITSGRRRLAEGIEVKQPHPDARYRTPVHPDLDGMPCTQHVGETESSTLLASGWPCLGGMLGSWMFSMQVLAWIHRNRRRLDRDALHSTISHLVALNLPVTLPTCMSVSESDWCAVSMGVPPFSRGSNYKGSPPLLQSG